MQAYTLQNQEERAIQPSLENAFSIGRTVGILLLFQLGAGLTLPFILSKPVTLGSPDFLTAVAAHSFQIRSAVLLSFAGSALTIWLGLIAFKIFRHYSKSIALLFLVACAVSCTLDIVYQATVLSMLSLSNHFVSAGDADPGQYQVVGSGLAGFGAGCSKTLSAQCATVGNWCLDVCFSFFAAPL
jgi:hypothetical protein